jgi:signal transduction histidine kinase
LLVASAVLAILIARIASNPLARLMRAAKAFSVSQDQADIAEKGPREVRAALATFNVMQNRVRAGFKDRTQLLASISHDLQTPLTRLRLRLEQVSDETLRQKLIADLGATQELVREGLDLARSTESGEEWSVVDLDSLVASIAEDAAEFGAPVQFTDGCGRNVRVKPNALGRCINNLIENAVRYGGDADVSCRADADRVVISVRDHGPGLSPECIERMFEPFVRGASDKIRGTGIGLTIARAQARTSGADVRLRNHAEGGLVAEIEIAA